MKEVLIKYRLEQAEDSLLAAEVLLNQAKSYRGSVNRAYYAMFYSVLALLAREGKGSSKHRGVIAMFDQSFVKTKIFPKEMSKAFHDIFELRQAGDYKEHSEIKKPDAEKSLQTSREFVKTIKEYLEK